jgi:hypothetical protein
MPIFNQTHSEQTLVEEAFEKMAEQYLEHWKINNKLDWTFQSINFWPKATEQIPAENRSTLKIPEQF